MSQNNSQKANAIRVLKIEINSVKNDLYYEKR